MTMAKVKNAPESTATRTLGRMMRDRIVVQPAPRLWAASVSVETSMVLRPVSTARYI
ncbi:hypothetical protein D3C73_1649360 [compost metagenome]